MLLITSVILSAVIAIVPGRMTTHHTAVHITAQLGVGLYVFCALLLAVGVLPWLLGRRHYAKTIGTLLIGNALLWSFISAELPRFNDDNSVKTLALQLHTRLAPGDEVISYRDYYQDLPFYLRQRITVAAYQGELEFGVNAETRVRQWMIGEDEFARRWQSTAQVYVITSHKNYQNLSDSARGTIHLLGQAGDNVLLSNH